MQSMAKKEKAYRLGECSISDLEESSKNLHAKVNLLHKKALERRKLIDAKID